MTCYHVGRYRALVNMWTRYGARPEMAALGLQNTEFSVVQGEGLNFSTIVR